MKRGAVLTVAAKIFMGMAPIRDVAAIGAKVAKKEF
jgi:hypothetical protein